MSPDLPGALMVCRQTSVLATVERTRSRELKRVTVTEVMRVQIVQAFPSMIFQEKDGTRCQSPNLDIICLVLPQQKATASRVWPTGHPGFGVIPRIPTRVLPALHNPEWNA